MHYVNAGLGIVLVILAAVQLGQSSGPGLSVALLGGAFLALITLRHRMSLLTVNVFAVATVCAMFFYFAVFFRLVPNLHHWYMRGEAAYCLSMLFAGFAKIPVLSEYSCRKKSEQCEESRHWNRHHFWHRSHEHPAPHSK